MNTLVRNRMNVNRCYYFDCLIVTTEKADGDPSAFSFSEICLLLRRLIGLSGYPFIWGT